MAFLRNLIEQRISDTVTEFIEVAGTANLESVLANRTSVPGCYVFRSNNKLGSAHGDIVITQAREDFVACVVVTRNVRDSRGAEGADENEALCLKIQESLLGWQPSAHHEPIEQASGKLVQFKNGMFIWMDIYKSRTCLNSLRIWALP